MELDKVIAEMERQLNLTEAGYARMVLRLCVHHLKKAKDRIEVLEQAIEQEVK